jgi:elongation factor G
MKQFIRNTGIMAHVDAGKTTLTERISAAATSCAWNGCAVTIIDTPGHADFTNEVERSLRILDSAIALFSAVSGVEPQSETVWRQADRAGVPRLCFINKMDQPGADFAGTVDEIRERLRAVPLVLQLPLGAEGQFRGVIDLLTMQALTWDGQNAPVVCAVPDELRAEAEAARCKLVEQLAETDDAALAAWMEDEHALDVPRLKALIRAGLIAGRFSPVLCGSAYRNIGVQPLLDAVADYCPSPLDRPPVEGINPDTGETVMRAPSDTAPLTAIVSKAQMSRFGALTFLRLYSGRMTGGTAVVNGATGKLERIGRILRMHADEETEITEAVAGDIVAVTGLKSAGAGDTLCTPGHRIVLSGLACPEPVISAVIEPRTAADQQRFAQSLAMICREDPSLRVSSDPETGQTLLHGMGELHLAICVESLKEEHNVEAVLGAPCVAYREAITRRAVVDYTLRKQTGGPGQFARLKLAFEPLPEGETGLIFEDRTSGGVVPAAFLPGIVKGLTAAMQEGGLAGFPVAGLRAALLDGACHARDSSPLAFELAARAASRQGFLDAGPVLLEPLMQVEIVTPGDYLGAITGDLQARRGSVTGSGAQGGGHVIAAEVPLANMTGYVSRLRSLSQGRARFSMRVGRYAPVPGRLTAEIVAAAAG